jgi:hypothetical protein
MAYFCVLLPAGIVLVPAVIEPLSYVCRFLLSFACFCRTFALLDRLRHLEAHPSGQLGGGIRALRPISNLIFAHCVALARQIFVQFLFSDTLIMDSQSFEWSLMPSYEIADPSGSVPENAGPSAATSSSTPMASSKPRIHALDEMEVDELHPTDSQSATNSRRRFREKDWLDHQKTLHRLWMVEGQSLAEVIEYMKQHHDFSPT